MARGASLVVLVKILVEARLVDKAVFTLRGDIKSCGRTAQQETMAPKIMAER